MAERTAKERTMATSQKPGLLNFFRTDVNISDLCLENGESFASLLECPVCMETMQPPIYLCDNGHNTCTKCKAHLNSCPSCRGGFTTIRNLTIEKMICNVKLPCTNHSTGCPEKVMFQHMESHMKTCSYRFYECFPGCKWRGVRSRLLQHAKSLHSKHFYCQNKVTILRNFYFQDSENFRSLISAFGELFWLRCKIDKEDSKYYEFVQYLGPKEDAGKFKYEHQLCTESGDQKIISTNKAQHDCKSDDDVFSSLKCFILDYKIVQNYLNKEGIFKYVVIISKI